jgi:hypothetical protein
MGREFKGEKEARAREEEGSCQWEVSDTGVAALKSRN